MSRALSPSTRRLAFLLAGLTLPACEPPQGSPTPEAGRGQVSARVSALAAAGIGNACYTLTVTNAEGDEVFSQAGVCADDFGDGTAGVAWVGACDAQHNQNRLTVSVDRLEDEAGNDIADFVDPCADGACTRDFDCVENADTAVDVSVTLVRPLGQGFVDVSVDLNEIRCSAKADCTSTLLRDPETGDRLRTVVLGLSCAATGDARTTLLRSALELDCGGDVVRLDPAVTGAAPSPFVRQAAFTGRTPAPNDAAFWNVALGLAPGELPPNCVLRGLGTAISGAVPPGGLPESTPMIALELPLTNVDGTLTCDASPLNGDDGVLRVVVPGADTPKMQSADAVTALPPNVVRVDASVIARQAALIPMVPNGAPRPLERVVDARGVGVDFARGEAVVMTDDLPALEAALAPLGGAVVATTPASGQGEAYLQAQHLIAFPVDAVDTADLADLLRVLNPEMRGELRLSSEAAMATLAVTARLAVAGFAVSLELVAESTGVADRSVTEGPGDTLAEYYTNAFVGGRYSPNPFEWPTYKRGGDHDTGVAEAWRALAITGRLGNRTRIAVIDGGFANGHGLPDGSHAISTIPLRDPLDTENTMSCGGDACRWHGTHVSQIAAGVGDDGSGIVGTGWPVSDLTMVTSLGDMFTLMAAYDLARGDGARIINTSITVPVPALLSFSVLPLNAVTRAVRKSGVMLLASAGNDARNVDDEDCFLGICWESHWVYPCENDGVNCIGGTEWRSDRKDGGSAYGKTVQLFAPYTTFVGSEPGKAGPGVQAGRGTSYSSPFVAGVAALVWAANPALNPGDVFNLLYGRGHTSSDPVVPRRVNAFASVLAALGDGNLPPSADILTPAPVGGVYNYGGFGVRLSAAVADVEDRLADLSIVWTTPGEGVIGTGTDATWYAPTPGPRTITLTVRDTLGATVVRSVNIDVVNAAPVPRIDAPTAATTLYRGVPFGLSGTAVDPNEGLGGFPCGQLTWRLVEDPAAGTVTGCTGTLTTSVVGPAHLVLSARDARGATGTTTLLVNIQAPPADAPPLVSILTPFEGQELLAGFVQTVTASAFDADGDAIVDYTWRVVSTDGTFADTIIGTGASLTWRPADVVPTRCGSGRRVILRCTATDATGASGSSEITVSYFFGPC
jgi:serine protease